MLSWHWVYYLRKIVNVLTVTSILTLSLTNLNFKIEHANISKGKDSNFIYFSASDNARGDVGGGGTPLYQLYKYVRPQRVWFLHSNLDMSIILRRSHFFIIIKKKINKSPLQLMFKVI